MNHNDIFHVTSERFGRSRSICDGVYCSAPLTALGSPFGNTHSLPFLCDQAAHCYSFRCALRSAPRRIPCLRKCGHSIVRWPTAGRLATATAPEASAAQSSRGGGASTRATKAPVRGLSPRTRARFPRGRAGAINAVSARSRALGKERRSGRRRWALWRGRRSSHRTAAPS